MVIFVGYSPVTSKGWRFWNPITDRIMESSDVIFDEDTGYSPSSFTQHHEAHVSIPPSVSVLDHNPIPLHVPPPILLPPVEPVGESLSTDSIPQIEDDTSDISPFSTPVHIPSNSPPDLAQSANPIDPLPDPHTPSSSHFPPSQSFEEPAHPKFRSLDDIYSASSHPETSTSPSTSFAHMVNTAETFREPATYKQATMSPQAGYWKAAREKDASSLMENRSMGPRFHLHQVEISSSANGYIVSNTLQLVRSTSIKQDLLLKDIAKYMALTTRKHLVMLLNMTGFVSSLLLLRC